MAKKRKLLSQFAVPLMALAILAHPAAAEESKADRGDEPTFLKRYTSGVQDLIIKGLEFVGVRYRYGGNNPEEGLDCSGFVRYVFRESLGTVLPRTARSMSEIGTQVDPRDLKPGDLVFFNTMRRTFSHVGIYVGNNQFLHAPKPGAEVRVEDMRQSYWLTRFDGARRILER
ncbi:C40 family peptidase [Azospira inquinata]|uniref:C40 family peptidase n=1 Tax=Azospira inquinata TaxID=2785627 RepID=A0A975SMM3_9RHOO|nr:C40 family peptidase [Azospira inquinata]QWT46041.1 C40 family peptidase [Azospira inquinata]QWT48629.1 C40 family peptidase [Azospira inquinata]